MLKMQTILIIIILILAIIKSILQKNKEMTQKQYFIDVLNHNLKICTLAQKHGMNLLMKEGAKTDLQKELFSSLYNSCKYNLDIISTLLNTFNLEKKEQYTNTERFILSSHNLLCNDILTEIMKEKNVKLTYNYQNHPIYANKTNLQSLLHNVLYLVLMYACKNTESVITINHNNNNLHISIVYQGNRITKDTGIYKTDDYMAIGCSIKIYYCKKIIDLYRGRINLVNLSNNKVSLDIILPIKNQILYPHGQKYEENVIQNISFCK